MQERSDKRFFKQVVEPTVEEFLSSRHCVRRGCLACLVLASMADHSFHANPSIGKKYNKVEKFRLQLGSDNNVFKNVLDVANATKHVIPIDHRGKERWIGFDDISSQDISFGNLLFGWPMWGREVMIEIKAGDLRLLSQLVEATTKMWRDMLAS